MERFGSERVGINGVGSDEVGSEASCLEPEVFRASEIDNLPEGAEEDVRDIGFFLIPEDSPSLRIFFFWTFVF